MKQYAHRIGAIFYALWGILHILGAAVLLQQASSGGATTVFATIGSATPVADLPQVAGGLATAVLTYYAWNLLWVGLFVLVVAIWLNWKNSLLGFWLNLVVVGAVDLGLLFTLIAPGHMALSDGLLGVGLWLPALLFSAIGLAAKRSPAKRQATLA